MRKDYSCLEPFVGLRGVCEDVVGALHINDLPGVEAKTFSKTANGEDVTGKEAFLRLRREAARRVAKNFLAKLGDKYDVEEVAERITLGDVDSRLLATTKTFTLENYYPQTSLHLEQIKVYADVAGEITIAVNGVSGTEAVVAGFNTFSRSDTGDKLEITVTGLNGVQIAYNNQGGNCGLCTTRTGTLPGVITYAIRCDQIVCFFAEDLADATRLMTVALLMEEVEYSDRTNHFVRNSKESAGRIRARILGGEDPVTEIKNKSLYWQEIGEAVKRAKLSGPCVTCNGLTYLEPIP